MTFTREYKFTLDVTNGNDGSRVSVTLEFGKWTDWWGVTERIFRGVTNENNFTKKRIFSKMLTTP